MPDLQPVAAAIAGLFLAMALTGQWLTLPVRLALRYGAADKRDAADAWWPAYHSALRLADDIAHFDHRIRTETDPDELAALRRVRAALTCAGEPT